MLSKDQLSSAINLSLDLLYLNDTFLIEQDVNERSLSHRLAMYLQTEINKLEEGWDVDCEYNRIGTSSIQGEYLTKRMNLPPRHDIASDDITARTVFPDINIHHRGQEGSKNNLLVVEIKKNLGVDDYDFEKLRQYGTELNYQWGAYLNICSDQTYITWWKRGEIQTI